MRTRLLWGMACLFMMTLSFAQVSKQKITRAADLPRFQYSVRAKVEDLVKSENSFRPFAAEARKNVESVLRDYDIQDPSAKRSLLNVLVALDILENRNDSARDRLAQIKALEEKPAAKALSGLVENAILDAHREVADHNSPAYRQAISSALKRSLDALSFDLVQNELKQQKASAEILTESILTGRVRASLDPVVEKTGKLSGDLAHSLPGLRMTLLEVIPIKDTLAQTIGAYLSAHAREKKDIWADRDVILDPGKKYQPVNVAVWDDGVDLAIFKNRVAKDANGNPAVLAYDMESRKTTGSLYPLDAKQSRRYMDVKKQIKGLMDLRANLDSPEAAETRQTMTRLKPEEVRPFIEELSLYAGTYAHGTHVAGILIAGNPYARLVTGRLTFDWKMVPDPCPSQSLVERESAAFQDFVNFFKKNSVRVVNMSWGFTAKDFEKRLELCAIGKDIEDRKKKAREWFDLEKNALENAMRSAPEILFVNAAGNSDSDTSFDEDISAIKLPNFLSVGAVDRAGDETSFTSYGPTVVVHANGYEVESYIPGGDRIKMSGTSMASPNTANLAAKIMAVNPKLSPAQVIGIIRATAEKTADGRRNLINPKRAIRAATAP